MSKDGSKHIVFECMPPKCGVALALVVADILSEGLDDDRIQAIGSFFSLVGQIMSYISNQMEFNEDVCPCDKTSASASESEESSD